MVADESLAMQFRNVIGQDTIKQKLREMVQQDRIPHAQLLLGNPGSGKLSLALAFAQYVLCENVNGQSLLDDKLLALTKSTAKQEHTKGA